MKVINYKDNYRFQDGDWTSRPLAYLPDQPDNVVTTRYSITNDPRQGKLTAEAARHLANHSRLHKRANRIQPTYKHDAIHHKLFTASPTRVWINGHRDEIKVISFMITMIAGMYLFNKTAHGEKNLFDQVIVFAVSGSSGVGISELLLQLNECKDPGDSPEEIRAQAKAAYGYACSEMRQYFNTLSQYDHISHGNAGIDPIIDYPNIVHHLKKAGVTYADAKEIAARVYPEPVRQQLHLPSRPALPACNPAANQG